MLLLKLHFSISVLCLITFVGFLKVYKEQLKSNGWGSGEDKKKTKITAYLIFFVPIMNIICVLLMFMMIAMKKSDYDKMCEETKKNSKESE